jgi:hypothetical protein
VGVGKISTKSGVKESVLHKLLRTKERGSLVVSWLGMGVARVLRVNASEPMVGWKGKHPHSFG